MPVAHESWSSRERRLGFTMSPRRILPYGVAVGGAVAITAAIGAVTALARVSGLSALYILLVLWIAARWGRGPAILGSILAFLLYDFFFVPPVGTFTVAGPAELLELVVLLAVALVTSQLAASLRRAQATAEAIAADSRALYELATAMLRTDEVTDALAMVGDSAQKLHSVERFAVLGQSGQVAGSPLTGDEIKQARWAKEEGRSIGIAIRGGTVVPMKTFGAAAGPAYLPLASGVVVLQLRDGHGDEAELRMLAALVGLAGLLLDRRRAALEADRARGFEASDRLKAAILSSLSHELKSPIASLRAGLTALTAPGAGLADEHRELLTDMDRQATRLDRMVGELLALSRLEAGVGLDREPHGFAELVGSAARKLRGELQGHEVVVRIPDDLPAIDVDEVQVGRLLTNLIENALEWAPADGGIEIGAASRDGRLVGWVENDGPEIPAADLDRVFDTFWTRRAKGTGLGLAIAKRVVEAHGGEIHAENRRRGPRFEFTLPLAAVAARR
jgi:two-component system, OmpR family, sensor histidine kinase KdpD